MRYVRSLSTLTTDETELVGNRAIDLARLARSEHHVPPSLVITNDAFELVILENKLQPRIAAVLEIGTLEEQAAAVTELLAHAIIPEALQEELSETFDNLAVSDTPLDNLMQEDKGVRLTLVLSPNHNLPEGDAIIRNAATVEQFRDALCACWALLFSSRVQQHRLDAGLGNRGLNAGVLVQRQELVDLTLEVSSGHDELLVRAYVGAYDPSGELPGDTARVSRDPLSITAYRVGVQQAAWLTDEEGVLEHVPLGNRGREQKLTDRATLDAARLGKRANELLDKHVRLVLGVRKDTVSTLWCDGLLLGSHRVETYKAEETIEASTFSIEPPPSFESVAVRVVEKIRERYEDRFRSPVPARTSDALKELVAEVVEPAENALKEIVALHERGEEPAAARAAELIAAVQRFLS